MPTVRKATARNTVNSLEKTQLTPVLTDAETPTKRPAAFREVYPISEPYVYAAIVRDPDTLKTRYEVIEPTLQNYEFTILSEIKTSLMEEVDVNLKDIETKEKAEVYLEEMTRKIIKKYNIKIQPKAIDKLAYYLIRDFLGYGKIDPLMNDSLIEDISTDGVNIPVYVWHRLYESLPTNIIFRNKTELDNYIIRLAYLAGKNISIASPLLDASLPEKSRIQLTYGDEITRRGSTFTIRRFRSDPLTISDLIAYKTLNSEMAAYLWYVIENRASVIVAGGVAAGKTTMLNSLSMFIKPEMKIVSVEDTQELNLPHENWIPSVVRLGFMHEDRRNGSITLFDLLKTAVRQRPDYIIVGEVRGQETFTLFQAIATGHLGMSTLHAESVEAVINRLGSEPMNIPKPLIAMTNVIMIVARTEIAGRPARRTQVTTELAGLDPRTNNIEFQEVFRWNQRRDDFESSGESSILEIRARKLGIRKEEIDHELQARKTILEWMAQTGIRRQVDVANIIREYYANPNRVFQKARVGLK